MKMFKKKEEAKISNKASGTRFENDFAEILDDRGFWVHLLQQNSTGQPCDIVAVNCNGLAFLIDAKETKSGRFSFERIEDNQFYAMEKFQSKTGFVGWFAIRLEDDSIWMFTRDFFNAAMDMKKYSLNEKEIKTYGTPIGRWLDTFDGHKHRE